MSARASGPRAFLGQTAQEAVTRVITGIEAGTAVEVVVAVRRAAGAYRESAYLFGFLVALAALLGLLYLPPVFPLWVFVPDVALAFVAGAFVGAHVSWIRRVLTPGGVQHEQVRCAARATFVDLPCSRLPRRNGVLVYVALLERRVEVVPDGGVRAAGDSAWAEACAALTASLRPEPDVGRFEAALRGLGAVAARLDPRLADDTNEISDAVDLR